MSENSVWKELVSEGFGTFILVIFGVGSVGVSVWTGSYGLWPVAAMWAIGVALGVYACGHRSGGHINPAVTITMAAFTDFPWKKVLPYVVVQLVGAFVAAAAMHLVYGGMIEAFEGANNLVRGEMGSQLSAMGYATYAPNPALVGTSGEALAQVSLLQWFVSEAIVTAILLFGIFFLLDGNNSLAPGANLAPLFIGLLVAALVAYEAPVSMTALNPARDLGPRLWEAIAGWGEIAFPGPRGGWWIPTISTIVGGLIGGGLYHGFYKKIFQNGA